MEKYHIKENSVYSNKVLKEENMLEKKWTKFQGQMSSQVNSNKHLRKNYTKTFHVEGFPSSSDGKEFACNAGDLGSVPGSGGSPGGGNGNPLQYFCLENPSDRGGWQATVHRVSQSCTWLKLFISSSIPKRDKDVNKIKRENYRPISLMNIDTKILKKY